MLPLVWVAAIHCSKINYKPTLGQVKEMFGGGWEAAELVKEMKGSGALIVYSNIPAWTENIQLPLKKLLRIAFNGYGSFTEKPTFRLHGNKNNKKKFFFALKRSWSWILKKKKLFILKLKWCASYLVYFSV